MALDIEELKQRAWKYVELKADTKVTTVEFVKAFTLFGREDVVLYITTTDSNVPEWWVVGGSTPINLYDKKTFQSADEAYCKRQLTMYDFSQIRMYSF